MIAQLATMGPQAVISHEGQPLLHQRIKGTIGPGGRLERIEDQRWFKIRFLFVAAMLIVAATLVVRPLDSSRWGDGPDKIDSEESILGGNPASRPDLCNDRHCFKKTIIHVRENQPGFPSFWNYAPHGPITVSYDERAILLNGTRSLFLGGSMHPARATPDTWERALDEAVRNGLNLITIYVFWGAHQPFPDSPFDWSLPGKKQRCKDSKEASCRWDLASAIQQAANRGLFVHARIGPYVCAEYSYGGIPEWVALNKPAMSMRRPNQEWMDAMEGFLKETIEYLTLEKLWAYQGGPIILGQVENELGDEKLDPVIDNVILTSDSNGMARQSTMQDYADWSGEIAAKYAPKVLWTMCNGLTASNAINSCNGYGGVSCSQGWLESHGQNGRIQIDQPALWTEDEGGFQVWGETPSQSSYFWGRTGRDFARDELKWFARGGTHLNYYMFWGSYNRGRSAAGGITNMYANDALLCPSGERRQPKYGHTQALHELLIELAPVLLTAPSALLKNQTVFVMGSDGHWVPGKEQRLFTYTNIGGHPDSPKEIAFIENDNSKSVVARVSLPKHGDQIIKMKQYACAVVVDGMLRFNSASINPEMKAFRRETIESPVSLLDWQSFTEPVGVDPRHPKTQNAQSPVEQTALMISSRVSSDYAWYETNFRIDASYGLIKNATLSIDMQKASALGVYLNGMYIGSNNDPRHEEGNITFSIDLGDISPASYKVSMLCENLGYGNLIGRWGASTKAKTKGITGSVSVDGLCEDKNCRINLVDGREWHSFAGLHGASFGDRATKDVSSLPGVWSRAHFDTPLYGEASQSLFLDITSGRGQLWLNGNDLGRFWNITRGDTAAYSQRYYFLPHEHLYNDGHLNELMIFNALGGDLSSTKLVLSGLVQDETNTFKDEVDFPSACI